MRLGLVHSSLFFEVVVPEHELNETTHTTNNHTDKSSPIVSRPASYGNASDPNRAGPLRIPIVLHIWLRGYHAAHCRKPEPSQAAAGADDGGAAAASGCAAGNLTILGVAWASAVDHAEAYNARGNMLRIPRVLNEIGWQPDILLQYEQAAAARSPRDAWVAEEEGAAAGGHPGDSRGSRKVDGGSYALKHIRMGVLQPLADEVGVTVPWRLRAVVPARSEAVVLSVPSKPEHMQQLLLPGAHTRCPLPEEHLGRTAMYVFLRPFRHSSSGTGVDRHNAFPLDRFGELLAFHAHHHLRVGFAGVVALVDPLLAVRLRRNARVAALASFGFLHLLAWAEFPYYQFRGLVGNAFEQRLLNNLIGLAFEFCKPGVRFAAIDYDELYDIPVPGARLQDAQDACFSRDAGPYRMTTVNAFIHLPPDATGRDEAPSASSLPDPANSSTTQPHPAQAKPWPHQHVDETALWMQLPPASGRCHPLCYYNMVTRHDTAGGKVGKLLRTKLMGNGGDGLQTGGSSPTIYAVHFTIGTDPWAVHNTTGREAQCGWFLHIRNMFRARTAVEAVPPSIALPYTSELYGGLGGPGVGGVAGSKDAAAGGGCAPAAAGAAGGRRRMVQEPAQSLGDQLLPEGSCSCCLSLAEFLVHTGAPPPTRPSGPPRPKRPPRQHNKITNPVAGGSGRAAASGEGKPKAAPAESLAGAGGSE